MTDHPEMTAQQTAERYVAKALKNFEIMLCGERLDDKTKMIIASHYQNIDELRYEEFVRRHGKRIDPNRDFLP
ncbi:hypothetical protein ACXZ1M_24295 [Duganella sp. PWIR1]